MSDIFVQGNVEGNIVCGDNNFVVNTNHGTIVRQEALSTQRRSLSPRPPAEPEGFVGRKRELQQVEDWITENKVVVIHGVDGIGKTSLLKQAANSECARSQPDGVVFLEGLDEEGKLLEFGDVVQRLFNSLFESVPPVKVDLSSAQPYLSSTHPLVLINSIALTVQNLGQLQNLFTKAPILVATENPVLMRASKSSIPLGPLHLDDSLALLASLTSIEDQETLTRIAALLENVPAALSMVADVIRINGLSADEVLRHLQAYTPKEQNKTKASVERAFQLVYLTLSEEERGMLDQVAAAFGISVDRKWLEQEYGGTPVSERLESLQLLQANSPRLRLMPGLKQILLQERDVTRQRERMLSHLLAELQTRWNDFQFVKDELGNLLGLLAWAAAQGQWANVAALGRAIDPYLTLRGHWNAWRKTLGEIQRAASATQNLALQGWVLHQLGTYEIGMGNLSAAQSLLEQAVSIRQGLGDEAGVAFSKYNLQAIAPVVRPAARAGKLTPWLVGGLAVIAAGAFLLFGNFGKSQAPPVVAPVVATTQVKSAASPSPTSTLTSTAAPTSSPTGIVTATFTVAPASSDTPTAVPSYAPLKNVAVKDSAVCLYGPGLAYQNKGTRRQPGNKVDLLGRIATDDGTWVNITTSAPYTDASDPCWMNARYLAVTGEQLMTVPPIDPANPAMYKLPYDNFSMNRYLEEPVAQSPARAGDTVNVYWQYFDVGDGEVQDPKAVARYIVEAWVCRNGQIVFSSKGFWLDDSKPVQDGDTVGVSITDEAGCTEPSHARLYLQWVHGYVGPVEIKPWPQSPTVQTPTP